MSDLGRLCLFRKLRIIKVLPSRLSKCFFPYSPARIHLAVPIVLWMFVDRTLKLIELGFYGPVRLMPY